MNPIRQLGVRLLAGAASLATLAAADLVNGKSFADFAAAFDRVQAAAEPVEDEKTELSAAKRAELIKAADRIVDGEIPFYGNEWIKVGAGDIDWFGSQRNHQEWIAQLNRFRYLVTLADAWEATGDAKYPARALALMEDFRQFVVDKHQKKFFDPQKDNRLNVSLRMLNWSLAIRRMGASPVFTDRSLNELLDFMAWELDNLDRVTAPGMSNFQVAQSEALMLTSLYFPGLPGSAKRLKHGAEVMAACLSKQFRPDGSHWENSAGYHGGMLRTAIKCQALRREFPEVPSVMTPAVFAGAVDFLYLAGPWGFNDHGIKVPPFPAFKYDLSLAKTRAAEAGLKDWQPPLYRAFPDAGVFFAGNPNEHVMFDAAKVGSGHSHNSRLMALYAAYGEILIADCGITTYEKSSPYYVGGRHTINHATVNPDNLAQRRVDAKVEFWKIEPDYAVLAGVFDAGYVKWEKGTLADRKPDLAATHRRTVIWLADASLLIFDRVAGKAERWNFVFPVPKQDIIETDAAKSAFCSVNAKRPNFRVRLLNLPDASVTAKVYEGDQSGPVARGWLGILTGGTPMPLLEFSAAGVTSDSTVVTRIAAAKPGEAAADVEVLERAADRVVFRHPDGRTDCWVWNASSFKLNAMAIEFKGEHLLLRLDAAGKLAAVFADRGEALSVDGKALLAAPGKPATGYLKP